MRLSSATLPMRVAKLGRLVMLTSLGLANCSLLSGQTVAGDHGIAVQTSQAAGAKTRYLRVSKDDQGRPQALQTAMTRFRGKDKDVIVDLIGAVHVGERDYYQILNSQFDLYDVVLYELVAPAGTRVPAGGKSPTVNPIGMLQQSMQKMLGLESQLVLIDYQKSNFVHADMSPTQIGEKMDERGETAFSVGLSAIMELLGNQKKMAQSLEDSGSEPIDAENLFELLNNPLKLKQMMAQQFSQAEAIEMGLGKTLNRMLIEDRNAAAMKVLHQQLAKGQTRIAIFYGAAHMPDFEQRLASELGLQPAKQVWLDAWDLKTAPEKPNSPTRLLFDMLRQLNQ
jgi:hypothetical protein